MPGFRKRKLHGELVQERGIQCTNIPKIRAMWVQVGKHSQTLRLLLSDPGGGGLSWASARAQPPTHPSIHPPTHPTLPPPGGGGVYAIHPQSHTSRAELTSKSLILVGMELRTFENWVNHHNQLNYHPVLAFLRNKGLRGLTCYERKKE